MLFGPKTVAFLLASAIASLTTAFLALVPGVYGRNLLLAAGLSLSASFVLIFLSLEFLVFREINKIYALIDKVKRKILSCIANALLPVITRLRS
jgi:two-component system phosphate regulon sensor histidine kinase PhoR